MRDEDEERGEKEIERGRERGDVGGGEEIDGERRRERGRERGGWLGKDVFFYLFLKFLLYIHPRK